MIQSPDGTDIHITEIQKRPPFDEDNWEELGMEVQEFVEEGIISYEEYHLKISKACDCYAKKKKWGDPTKKYHSGDCASWRVK